MFTVLIDRSDWLHWGCQWVGGRAGGKQSAPCPCRAHLPGECAASECSLLCNDLLRLGYSRFVTDPGVRQAYTIREAQDLYNPQFLLDVNATSWQQVAAAPAIDWNQVGTLRTFKMDWIV
jgi:hypothetical protein